LFSLYSFTLVIIYLKLVSVGYLNYRYFCNFLWFVELGMMYGAFVTYLPWKNCGGPLYKNQVSQFRKTGVWKHIYPHVPIPRERMPISLTFMLCLAIGIAVACLGGFHLYLVLTGQTTIEFHGNFVNKRKARKSGHKFKTPYDLGWRRNWQQVYGTSHPLIALLPSRRPPEFLPLPIPGDEGKRAKYESKAIAAITASLEEKNGDMIV
jgi:palmitoyltransferase